MSRNANIKPTSHSRGGDGSRGFTLIELLSVIAVMTVMMVTVLPAFTGIRGAGNVTKVAYDVAGTLEQARSYAMANNTYVFVGFTERDGLNAANPGSGQILVAAMGSKDGTRKFDASNLVALSKLRRFENMHLEDSLPNSGAMTRPAVQDFNRVGNDAFQADGAFTVSGQEFKKIIQFDPRGTASVQSGTVSIPHWMEIGLVAAKGGAVVGKSNCAALVLDGVTGSAKIYRP